MNLLWYKCTRGAAGMHQGLLESEEYNVSGAVSPQCPQGQTSNSLPQLIFPCLKDMVACGQKKHRKALHVWFSGISDFSLQKLVSIIGLTILTTGRVSCSTGPSKASSHHGRRFALGPGPVAEAMTQRSHKAGEVEEVQPQPQPCRMAMPRGNQ